MKLWFGRGARRLGVRADVGLAMRDGGFDFSEDRRTTPTAGVSLVSVLSQRQRSARSQRRSSNTEERRNGVRSLALLFSVSPFLRVDIR